MKTATRGVVRNEDNIWIEVSRLGVVGVHADIADTGFLNLIGPAISNLDQTIQRLQSVINSAAFAQMMEDAAEKLQTITPEGGADATQTATT